MKHRSALALAVVISGVAMLPSLASAQCAVPNVLTNGQVADASEVMENFNAVAECSNTVSDTVSSTSVTTSGTPTAGSIAVFSGPKVVTAGNLTGDVTTSGGTSASLANTGVAAGTYADATFTVDSKGRITYAANGNGTVSPTPPLTTAFSANPYALAAGSSTIIDVSTKDEVIVIARNITKSVSGSFAIQFSLDGGASYVSTASYVVDVSTSGSVGFNDTAIYSNGNASAARTHFMKIEGLRSSGPKVYFWRRSGIFTESQPITHLRIYSTAGNITGGSLVVMVR